MRIDEQVEPLVREALTAVVKSDPERLRQALTSFPDDNATIAGTRLATAVALYVLDDVYGHRPTPAELRSVADKLVEMEDWTDVTADEVTMFLVVAHDGTRADRVLPADRITPLAYLIAGNLLSSCCKEGEFWFNYLDRAESALEASPDD
jgi:hypothetical protein